eukprot:scaffold1708_cov156-Ochromonas_danica.AAC.3
MAESEDMTILKVLEFLQAIDRIPEEVINQPKPTATPSQEDEKDRNTKGLTALEISAENGYEEMVKLLLLHPEINVNAQNSVSLNSALYRACENGHVGVIKALLNDRRVEFGWCPFHVACSRGNIEAVQALLSDDRLEVNIGDMNGWTALHAACGNGHVEVVKALLSDRCLNINALTKHKWTALFAASRNGHMKVVETLLSDGRVDANKPARDGKTALDVAKISEIKDLLRAYGGANLSTT